MAKKNGYWAEYDVLDLIPCPNCGRKLKLLPQNNPLFDVQCCTCYFRAQVKGASNLKPHQNEIFGATWEIMNKVLKAGNSVPPLLVNYKWLQNGQQHQTISFYPFIPKANLRRYTISPGAQSAGSKRFNYIGMKELPHFELYKTPKLRKAH